MTQTKWPPTIPARFIPVFDAATHKVGAALPDVPDPERDRVIRAYTVVPLTDNDRWDAIRERRDALLLTSDRTSLVRWADRWAAQTEAWRTAWTAYRQALRDLPETYSDPLAVVWPDPPG